MLCDNKSEEEGEGGGEGENALCFSKGNLSKWRHLFVREWGGPRGEAGRRCREEREEEKYLAQCTFIKRFANCNLKYELDE